MWLQMSAIPRACVKTRIRELTVEEFVELDLATDEAVGRVEPVNRTGIVERAAQHRMHQTALGES